MQVFSSVNQNPHSLLVFPLSSHIGTGSSRPPTRRRAQLPRHLNAFKHLVDTTHVNHVIYMINMTHVTSSPTWRQAQLPRARLRLELEVAQVGHDQCVAGVRGGGGAQPQLDAAGGHLRG